MAAERNRSPTDKQPADLPVGSAIAVAVVAVDVSVVSAAVAVAVVVGMAVSEQQEFLSVL